MWLLNWNSHSSANWWYSESAQLLSSWMRIKLKHMKLQTHHHSAWKDPCEITQWNVWRSQGLAANHNLISRLCCHCAIFIHHVKLERWGRGAGLADSPEVTILKWNCLFHCIRFPQIELNSVWKVQTFGLDCSYIINRKDRGHSFLYIKMQSCNPGDYNSPHWNLT